MDSLVSNDPYAAHGPQKYESAEAIAERVMQDIGREEDRKTRMDQYIRWIWEALNDLKAPIAYKTNYVELTPCDCVMEKPCDMIALNRMLVLNNSLYGVGDFYNQWQRACGTVPMYRPIDRAIGYNSYTQWWGPEYNPVYNEQYTVQEDPVRWLVSSNMNGCLVGVEYKAWAYGPDGYPIVDETYYDAIKWYILRAITIMSFGSGANRFSMSEREEANRQYVLEKRRARHDKFFEEATTDGLYQLGAIANDARTFGGPYSRIQKSNQFLYSMFARRFANWYGTNWNGNSVI